MIPDPELLRNLELAVLTMAPLPREIFLMHRLDDAAYPEIAKHFGISVREVERYMATAIGHLDRVLSALEDGSPE